MNKQEQALKDIEFLRRLKGELIFSKKFRSDDFDTALNRIEMGVKGMSPKMVSKECAHMYSRSMNQEYPRKCIICGERQGATQPLTEPAEVSKVTAENTQDRLDLLRAIKECEHVIKIWESHGNTARIDGQTLILKCLQTYTTQNNTETTKEHAIKLIEAIEAARNNYQVLNEQYVVPINVLDVIIEEYKNKLT